jgi:hypothetical protein
MYQSIKHDYVKKSFLFLLLFLGSAKLTFAQPSNDLAKQAKQKFEGRWIGIIGTDTVTFVFVQQRTKIEDINPVDSIVFLYGWHAIANDKGIVESSLDSISTELIKTCTVIASFKEKYKRLQLSVHDLTRERWLAGELVLISKDKAILTTKLKEVWRKGGKQYLDGQTFPMKIIMKKIYITPDSANHHPIVSIALS